MINLNREFLIKIYKKDQLENIKLIDLNDYKIIKIDSEKCNVFTNLEILRLVK